MNTPENYYAILGVPPDADNDTVKRAYRQLARRFHPDLAGPAGALEMKRINRAYAVLGDDEKRQHYDTIISGVLDLRSHTSPRPQSRPHTPDDPDDVEFSGMHTFSTRGPFHAGPVIRSSLGVTSALSSVYTVHGILIAAGSLDGHGMLWQIHDDQVDPPVTFASDPAQTIESLRELRFSAAGSLLAGWGRLGLHAWGTYNGERLWSYPLLERAVSAHYSLDMVFLATQPGQRVLRMALPYLPPDEPLAPRSKGVRGTDLVSHDLTLANATLFDTLTCAEENMEKRQFWAIRMRALAHDARSLLTLSCAQVPHEQQQMAIVRSWDLTTRTKLGGKLQPQIRQALLVGTCADCTPPYAVNPDANMLAFVSGGNTIRICDINAGNYSELASGLMGGSSRMALSPDGTWLAVAREDSEVNEGVIDLWSVTTGQIMQKFYHPWQISALHFAEKHLIVALTDGTIQIWQ